MKKFLLLFTLLTVFAFGNAVGTKSPAFKWMYGGKEVSAASIEYLSTQKPTVDNPYGLTPTVTSSNENVAKVRWGSTNVVFTLKDIGTTTITVSYPGDDTYAPCTATLVLTVTPKPLELPSVDVDPTTGKITLTRNGSYGILVYYNGPKSQTGQIASNEWVKMMELNGNAIKERVIDCLEGRNYVYAYTASSQTYFKNSNAIAVVYDYGVNSVADIEADDVAIKVNGRDIIAPSGAEIFTTAGQRVSGSDLIPGIYVVRLLNGQAIKVLVK